MSQSNFYLIPCSQDNDISKVSEILPRLQCVSFSVWLDLVKVAAKAPPHLSRRASPLNQAQMRLPASQRLRTSTDQHDKETDSSQQEAQASAAANWNFLNRGLKLILGGDQARSLSNSQRKEILGRKSGNVKNKTRKYKKCYCS